MSLDDPQFPPLLTGHAAGKAGDPLLTAYTGIQEGKLGAGDIVWSRNLDRAVVAIILEPDVSLDAAVEMLPLSMVACGDCLGVLTPPQVSVTFHWPGTIKVNNGRVGGIRAAIDLAEDTPAQIPEWMIIETDIRLKHSERRFEPGQNPDITALSEEGCPDLTRTEFIESYSRHFLTWLNNWQEDGFKSVHDAWIFRTEDLNEDIEFKYGDHSHRQKFIGLDEHGNLLVRSRDGKHDVYNLRETMLTGKYFESGQ